MAKSAQRTKMKAAIKKAICKLFSIRFFTTMCSTAMVVSRGSCVNLDRRSLRSMLSMVSDKIVSSHCTQGDSGSTIETTGVPDHLWFGRTMDKRRSNGILDSHVLDLQPGRRGRLCHATRRLCLM